MKSIKINNTEIFYQIVGFEGEYGLFSYKTYFYKNVLMVPEWTFFKWKSKNMVEKPGERIFIVDVNIENPKYTSEEIRKKIDKCIAIYSRKLDIQNGQII